MSSARIAPIPRSPRSRSQPWPRAWNGKRGSVIVEGVPSGSKLRSSPPASSAPRPSSSVTSPELEPRVLDLDPETARTRSTTEPSRRRSRNFSARSTSERRRACQRPWMRISGSFAAASSTSSSSVRVVSPIASFQSKRASESVAEQPARAAGHARGDEVDPELAGRTRPSSAAGARARRAPRAGESRCAGRTARRRRSARSRSARPGRTRAHPRRAPARSARAGGARRSVGRPSGGSRTPRRRRRSRSEVGRDERRIVGGLQPELEHERGGLIVGRLRAARPASG